ncbi:glycine receptor subunit alpha-3-like [Lethenteron reissneri]|uniref:glycine receptor subunit alpha-3-like n=1 Tax=Lethenteron reissneri TaxID=7753 RepID=UPI002AB75F78|nr:glycine receptor subunit alpha-3-like [Lethenteron reissneri]
MARWKVAALSLHCWLAGLCCSSVAVEVNNSSSRSNSSNLSPSELLESLIGKTSRYDYRVRPNFGGAPTVINCSIFIENFGSISETTMDYKVSIFMRQIWNDPRLSYTGSRRSLALDSSIIGSIWRPDLFFSNEMSGSFHSVTTDNRRITVYSNGDIFYSLRLSLTLSCHMDLHNFPMDTQVCLIYLESYGYTLRDLLFQWLPGDAVTFADGLSLPQFQLMRTAELGDCTKTYVTGSFTCIDAKFVLHREMGFYLIQLYIPSILIVIISWVSFWINMNVAQARVGLGITTVLTMTTQSTGSRSSMPKLSYINAMDVWMTACLFFVFGALLEYIMVVMTAMRARSLAKTTLTTYHVNTDEGCAKWMVRAQGIDNASRFVFPISFAVFNVAYWLLCLQSRGK